MPGRQRHRLVPALGGVPLPDRGAYAQGQRLQRVDGTERLVRRPLRDEPVRRPRRRAGERVLRGHRPRCARGHGGEWRGPLPLPPQERALPAGVLLGRAAVLRPRPGELDARARLRRGVLRARPRGQPGFRADLHGHRGDFRERPFRGPSGGREGDLPAAAAGHRLGGRHGRAGRALRDAAPLRRAERPGARGQLGPLGGRDGLRRDARGGGPLVRLRRGRGLGRPADPVRPLRPQLPLQALGPGHRRRGGPEAHERVGPGRASLLVRAVPPDRVALRAVARGPGGVPPVLPQRLRPRQRGRRWHRLARVHRASRRARPAHPERPHRPPGLPLGPDRAPYEHPA